MSYQEFFSIAKSRGISNIQITEDTNQENSVYLINNKLDDLTDCENISYTIKAEINGKTVQLYTEYLDESIIDLILEKIAATDSHYEDEYLENKENNYIEKNIETDIDDEINKLINLNMLKEKYPLTKSLETAYSNCYTKTRIINSNGVDVSTDGQNYELYVEASAEKNGNISSYSEGVLVNVKDDIDFTKIINSVLELASLAATTKKLETKKYDIVLSNTVAAKIINNLQEMLSAESVHKKKSCLERRLNEKVFSDKITIVEEPLNSKYPGYTIFDKEGTKTENKKLIKNGIIKTYLYDIKEAKVDNTKSTGNKYKKISTRNMYIVPGTKELKEIFKKINNGIYITHYMGSMGTSINTTSGSISMQVFGYIIEEGKLISGFEPAVLTSSIFEILNNIEEIGNDLKFITKSVGSPSLYIKDISIAAQ